MKDAIDVVSSYGAVNGCESLHRSLPWRDSTIRVEEVNDSCRLGSYRGHWDGLVARSPHASMFDTYQWLTSWLVAFWENRPIRFLFFWAGDELQGIAPLVPDEHGDIWCASTLVYPVNCHGNRASVICSDNPAAILEALLAHLQRNGRCPKLAFPDAFAPSPVATVLPAVAADAGMSSLVFPSSVSPLVRISGDWPSYLKSRSSHLAKEVRRKVRQFNSAGRAEIKVVSRTEDCAQAMRDIVQIDMRSWKREKAVSLDVVPHARRFFETFAQAGAAGGLLRSYLLYLDSKPVCYLYGVVFRNEYYALRTSYDSEYKRLSPGVVLFDRILGDAFEQGLEVVDFGPGGDSRWKHDFANDVRTQVNVCVFPSDSMRCRVCSMYKLRLKPFAKKYLPLLVKIKNRLCPTE